MPSASNNKLEKQTSVGSSVHSGGGPVSAGGPSESECIVANNNKNSNNETVAALKDTKEKSATASANDANNPMKLSLITIEHKIRNLEKRKTKLESYRDIQATGKELSADQKAAVAKYDAVMATLEFARDLSKQMLQFTKDAEKEQKKQARKDIISKAHAETAKIREVLIIQNILTCFSDEAVRADFLSGDNGAVKLDSADLDALEKFCLDIQARRPESAEDIAFVNAAQKAAEYFSMTIDGRPKQYGETTFENLRKVFQQIQDSGYLDKIYLAIPETSITEPIEEEYSAVENEENTTMGEDNLFEEGLDKLSIGEAVGAEIGIGQGNLLDGTTAQAQDGNVLMQTQQLPSQLDIQQPQHQIKEPLEIQQQQQQLNAPLLPQQQQQQQQAPPATAVAMPNFQPQQQPPPPTHSSSATPVHVAMYQTQQLPPPQQLQQVPPGGIINVQQVQPPAQMVAAGAPLPQQQQQQRQMMTSPAAVSGQQLPPPQGTPMPLPPGHYPPTTVRAVEQSFFKQHQQHHQQQHQYMQHMRPLAEVIGGGSFYFLQDSELDSPELCGANVAPSQVATVVFEHQQQLQQQQQQQAQVNMLNHVEMQVPQEQQLPQQQQLQQQQMVNNAPQQQQPIPTQTFTNQSFPTITPATVAANNSQTPILASNSPSPMFQPKSQQIFSPVAGLQQQQQLLQQQQQQQQDNPHQQQQQLLLSEQQQPMMIMTRLAAPQARLPTQQQPPLGIQAGEVVSGFSAFESPVVNALSYEQQMTAAGASLQTTNIASTVSDEQQNIVGDSEPPINEWDNTLKRKDVLKPASIVESSNKWSAEMNALGTPPTPSGGGNIQAPTARKNEWATNASGERGAYGDVADDSNHWQQDSVVSHGGYGRGGNRSNYQRRGDDRRGERDDRGGPPQRSGNSGYRGRSNYGNSTSSQQNGGRGGNSNSGIYFRNNDNSSSAGGGSSYYQNGSGGGGYNSSKDATGGSRYDGGNYRGPRGGNGGGNVRSNAPPTRAIGRGGGGGSSANTNSSSSASYMHPRQSQSNRMPMGLENKN